MKFQSWLASAFWSHGYRPFFLVAAIYSILLMSVWMMIQSNNMYFWLSVRPSDWHGHEMIFGFVTAVLAGFLLTVSQKDSNHEGMQGCIKGGYLLALVGLWGLARLTAWIPGEVAATVFSVTDLLFIPLLARCLWPLFSDKAQKTHRKMFWLLALLFMGNLMCHIGFLIDNFKLVRGGLHTGLHAYMIFIVYFGGQMIPSLARRLTEQSGCRNFVILDRLCFWSLVILGVASSSGPTNLWVGRLALIAGILNLTRWLLWRPYQSYRTPILWTLFMGYLWLCIGLIMLGWTVLFSPILPSLAIHAVTIGGLGMLIFGMLSWLPLSHSGLSLRASKSIVLAYVSLNLAVILRVLWPMLNPEAHYHSIIFSGSCWLLAYLLFIPKYFKLLYFPKVKALPIS